MTCTLPFTPKHNVSTDELQYPPYRGRWVGLEFLLDGPTPPSLKSSHQSRSLSTNFVSTPLNSSIITHLLLLAPRTELIAVVLGLFFIVAAMLGVGLISALVRGGS